MILVAIAIIAGAYQLLALIACVLFRTQKSEIKNQLVGPVSILKPIRGLDPSFRDAIQSHVVLEGEYELLCGIRDPNDPALNVLREFPTVKTVDCGTRGPNRKVAALMDLTDAAKYPVLIVNDSDIRVEKDYLRRVTAPLNDPKVGLVTCLYRPIGATFAARFEGLGVSTDFVPSTLVARLLGVDEFAMGSTLAFRRSDLKRIGGFGAIAEYLADDYQLGRRIHSLGLKCVVSDVVVETHLGGNWRDVWEHQVRWARTIRLIKSGGYLGLPVTNATLWAGIAALFGYWQIAIALLAIRLLLALAGGWFVICSRDVLQLLLLVPVRDVFGFFVWLTALFGDTVIWRGKKLRLDSEGRILAETQF